ncbi:hypothetical protein REPUB_Repub08aG0188700 [Reevesia pubescens]
MAARLANTVSNSLKGRPVQGRVFEGKEPPQFVSLFQPMVVLKEPLYTIVKHCKLMRSYTKYAHDYTLSEMPEVQRGMKLILNLCLSDGFDTFPTLLCADGCSMIDRRMVSHLVIIKNIFDFFVACISTCSKQDQELDWFIITTALIIEYTVCRSKSGALRACDLFVHDFILAHCVEAEKAN